MLLLYAMKPRLLRKKNNLLQKPAKIISIGTVFNKGGEQKQLHNKYQDFCTQCYHNTT